MVVDLDGTLVDGNTLHLYIICGLERLLRRGKIIKAASIAGLLMLRAMHAISHRAMKFGAVRHIDPSDKRLRDMFVTRIGKRVNIKITELITQWREEGKPVLLATAAPEAYVPWIWHDDFLATPVEHNPERIEMRADVKADAVRVYAASNNYSIDTIVTDHHDDLPLMKLACGSVCLVSPSAATMCHIQAGQFGNLVILS